MVGMRKKQSYTQAMLRAFDDLTQRESGPNGHDRVLARLELRKFVDTHGKAVCDEMFAVLQKQDKKREGHRS